MAVDFLAALGAAQQLVPNLRQQDAQDQQLRAMAEQRQLQSQALQLKQQEMLQEQARKQQFDQALTRALSTGKPGDISRLMLQFPEYADKIKPGYEALRDDDRRTTQTQLGSAFARGQAGDFEGAAALIQQRYDADVAAGQQDDTTKQVLDGLKSGDPVKQKAALGSIGVILSAIDPEKFSSTYKDLNPADKTSPTIREYEDRVQRFGKPAADQWLATQDTKLIPVNPGGSVYNAADFVGGGGAAAASQPNVNQGGGGQAISATGSAIESAALAAIPGLTVTSRQRSPSKNKSVGGVQNSYHLTDQARDFVPPKGMTFAQLASRLRQTLPGFDVINEGDHVHVEPGSRKSVVQSSKTIGGKTYYMIGGKWFDNPEGR